MRELPPVRLDTVDIRYYASAIVITSSCSGSGNVLRRSRRTRRCRRRRSSLATSVVLQSVTVAGLREDPDIIEFGRFKVVRHRRELLADGRPVELGGRAFDTLLALIDARGSVLGKDELMSRVWPDQVVEEQSAGSDLRAAKGFWHGS